MIATAGNLERVIVRRVTPDVFAPARLGPVTLRNRTVKAATFEGCTPHGQVTDALVDYHLAVARGGVGLTTVAYLAVAPEGRTHAAQVVVGEPTLAGLTRLADEVHAPGPRSPARSATPGRSPTAAPTGCAPSPPAGCRARCRCSWCARRPRRT